MTNRKPSIFISYGRGDDHADFNDADKSFLRKLYTDLTTDGYTVWWDRESMPARGLEFIKEIENAITEHDRMILIVGPHGIGSDYVRYEWEHANKLCKPITPILLKRDDDIKADKDQYGQIPTALQNFHALTALDWDSQAKVYPDMLEELKRVLKQEEQMGKPHGFPMLPKGYIQREGFTDIETSLLTKTIENTPVVIEPHEQVRAVQGTGGIGKTTLANALGRSCKIRRHFIDGTYFVRLGRVGDISLPLMQATLGMALGDKDTTGYIDEEQGRVRLSLLLRDKQALIVLDDVWDIKQKRAFEALGENCRMLITTRQRNIVPRATTHKLNKLTEAEGVELIGRWLDRTPTDPNPHIEQEKRIITLVDGYTLAIAISAAKLAGGYSHESLIKRLEAGRTFKDLKLGKGEDKNDNLEKAIFLSYDDLSGDNQRRFRQLGVLAPSTGFVTGLAGAIWDEDEFDSEDGLQALLNSALLDRDEDTGEWKQHSLLRAYAAALLSEDDEHEIFTRYVTHITDTCEFNYLKMQDWDTNYEHLYPHIDYLGDTLTDRYPRDHDRYRELMGEFMVMIHSYLVNRPLLREGAYRGLDWLMTAIELYADSDQKNRQSLMLNQCALIYDNLGQKQKALDMYQQVLEIDRQMGNRSGEATTFNNIGMVYRSQGRNDEALEMYQQALPIIREVGDRSGEATTLNNIGMVYSALGQKQQALEEMFQQVLPIRREVGDRSGEATTLNNIGKVYDDLGRKQEALEMYQKALPIWHEVGDRRSEATTLNNIGMIYRSQGQNDEALEMYQQALPMHREVGNRSMEATTSYNMAMIYYQRGDLDTAIQYLERTVEIEKDIGDPHYEDDRAFLEQVKRERDGSG